MVTAYLGIGSNLGDRFAYLTLARDRLSASPGIVSLRASSLYETEPVGGPDGQGAYLNAALEVMTTLSAEELLELCQRIEAEAGRERTVHHGPRTLDIDLLLYDDTCCRSERLTLPHPHLHERRFALAPLCDLAPRHLHPLLGVPLQQLLTRLPDNGVKPVQKEW